MTPGCRQLPCSQAWRAALIMMITSHECWQPAQVDLLQRQLPQLHQRRQGSRQPNAVLDVIPTGDTQAGEQGKVAHAVWNLCWRRAVPAQNEIAQCWPAAGDNGVDGHLAGKRLQVHRQCCQPGAAPEVLRGMTPTHALLALLG